MFVYCIKIYIYLINNYKHKIICSFRSNSLSILYAQAASTNWNRYQTSIFVDIFFLASSLDNDSLDIFSLGGD